MNTMARRTPSAMLTLCLLSLLGACGGSGVSGSPSAGTAATGGPASANPDQVAATRALTAFSSMVGQPGFSYRIEQQAHISVGTQQGVMIYKFAVAGSDFDGTMQAAGGTKTLHYVMSGGKAWGSFDGGSWKSLDPAKADAALWTAPWRLLGDLATGQPRPKQDSVPNTNLLAIVGPIAFAPTAEFAPGSTGTIQLGSLYLADDGSPVASVIGVSLMEPDGTKDFLSLAAKYSDVGASITISAPVP